EEARLRRRAVLASQKIARAAPAANDSGIFRSEFNELEAKSDWSASEEPDSGSTELEQSLPSAVPHNPTAKLTRSSWLLFIPGIAVGFVLAIVFIGWTASPNSPTTPVGVVETIDPGKRAPRALAANGGQNFSNGESPLVSYMVRPQARVIPAPDTIDPPAAAGWSSYFGAKSPAQVIPATVELPPLIDVSPPARFVGPPSVLSEVPPARPISAEPPAIAVPEISLLDIVLHVPTRARQSDAQELIAAATGAGFEIGTVRPAGFNISRTNIRYFHDSDAASAGALASAINARLRDFTDFRPPPDPGVVEVWLEGRGTPQRGQEDIAERRRIFQDLRTELRRIFRPTDG
ncbi:MAG: hypothetical protein ACR2OY_03535, partial [Boseongicola sp.]